MKSKVTQFVVFAVVLLAGRVEADGLMIAVASNFATTLQKIGTEFERQTSHKVTLVSGATGRFYAQISSGAPYDIFFSADAETPAKLEAEGKSVIGTRIHYASGRLALWSKTAGYVGEGGTVLKEGNFRSLAIANPRLAPYGEAAIEVLTAMGLQDTLASRFVMGENIAQTFQFVDTGNAELGFVAYSQVLATGQQGSFWLVPSSHHQPLLQDLVILKDSGTAREFLAFLQQDAVQSLIVESGYEPPASQNNEGK